MTGFFYAGETAGQAISGGGKDMNTKQLIDEVMSLPVEERALVVDSLLRSLNRTEPHIDRLWAEEARRRLSELRSGRVQAVPGEEVFRRVRERFEK